MKRLIASLLVGVMLFALSGQGSIVVPVLISTVTVPTAMAQTPTPPGLPPGALSDDIENLLQLS